MESAAGSRRGYCTTLRVITGTATSPLVAHVAQTACADLRSSRSRSLTSPHPLLSFAFAHEPCPLCAPTPGGGSREIRSFISAIPDPTTYEKNNFFYTSPKTVEGIYWISGVWMDSCHSGSF